MKAVVLLALAGCTGSSLPADVDAPPQPIDARPDSGVDKSAPCVGNFGNSLTNGFGRLDGTIVAVLQPGNTTCPAPNDTHLILEVRVDGEVYRMVAAMKSQTGNPDMALAERDAPLAGPAWQEGWHVGAAFDYVTTLGLHRLDFTPIPMLQLADTITAHFELGARVSVFATVENQFDSAHLIHRNQSGEDGGFVVNPDTAPHYMLTRFDNQLF